MTATHNARPTTAGVLPGVTTAIDLIERRVAESGHDIAYRQKLAGEWVSLTWAEVHEHAREIAAALLALGLQRGDRVALMAHASTSAVIADMGIQLAGGGTVPIYSTHTPANCAYIIGDARPRVVFVEDGPQLDKLLSDQVRAILGEVDAVVCLDDAVARQAPAGVSVQRISEFRARGRDWLASHEHELERRKAAITADDIFRVAYTSGTTGTSKGAVLLHRSIVGQCRSVASAMPFRREDEHLMTTPLARTLGLVLEWVGVAIGYRTAFASGRESGSDLFDELAEIQPTFIGAGPPFYRTVYQRALEAAERTGRVEALSEAMRIAGEVSRLHQSRTPLPTDLARDNARVYQEHFAQVRAWLGGRLRFAISGGIPLPAELGAFIEAAGCTIYEGYGMTEAAGFTHFNRPTQYRFGVAGPALPDVEQQITESGELLIRGPMLLREYWNREDATRRALDGDGWYHSGDLGVLEEDGSFRFIDRRANVVTLASGEEVPPQGFEIPAKMHAALKEVVVTGYGRPHPVALVTLQKEYVTRWATTRGVTFDDYGDLTRRPELHALVQEIFDSVNATLPASHRVHAFAILPRDFSTDRGEMTQTLKPKRDDIARIHAEVIDGLYAPGSGS